MEGGCFQRFDVLVGTSRVELPPRRDRTIPNIFVSFMFASLLVQGQLNSFLSNAANTFLQIENGFNE